MPGGGEVRILEIPASTSPTKRAATARDWLIVSTVPGDAYGEEALEAGLQQLEWVAPRALAHEAVVEHFLAAPAVLPMQLFTMFTGDARAVEHVVGDKRRIAAIMKRIEGQVEWGLRLTLEPEGGSPAVTRKGAARAGDQERAARAGDQERAARAGDQKRAARAGDQKRAARAGDQERAARAFTAREKAASGAAYLAHKRDQLDLARTRLKKARSEANRMYKAVSREATGARRRTATEQAAPGSRLVLDAAFLVPARRAAGFRAAVGRKARPLKRAGLTVSLTGPWPAYNFI